jgi:hypothetical protein
MPGRTVRTLLVIIARDIREHLRSLVVWSLVLFAATLSSLATWVSLEALKLRMAAHDELVVERELERDRRGNSLTGWQMEPSLRVLRPPEPLSAIVGGSDASSPAYWDFGPAGRRTGQQYARAGRPRDVDLEFVIRIVLGLLAVILAVESIAGQRADGALLALLGQPVHPATVIAGKLAAGALTLAASVALVLVATCVAVQVGRPEILSFSSLTTVAVGLAGWLYLMTYFALAAFIASAVSSHRGALIATVVIWLFSGVIAASLAEVTAQYFSPAPAAWQVESERERMVQQSTREAQMEMGDHYLRSVPPGVDWQNASRDPVWAQRMSRELTAIWSRHLTALDRELGQFHASVVTAADHQRFLLHLLQLASPGAQFTAAGTSLAGTGERVTRRWDVAIAKYQAFLTSQLFQNRPRHNVLVPAEPRRGPAVNGRWIVGLNMRPPPTWESLAGFDPPDSSIQVRLKDAALNIGALTAYALALMMSTVIIFCRLEF